MGALVINVLLVKSIRPKDENKVEKDFLPSKIFPRSSWYLMWVFAFLCFCKDHWERIPQNEQAHWDLSWDEVWTRKRKHSDLKNWWQMKKGESGIFTGEGKGKARTLKQTCLQFYLRLTLGASFISGSSRQSTEAGSENTNNSCPVIFFLEFLYIHRQMSGGLLSSN